MPKIETAESGTQAVRVARHLNQMLSAADDLAAKRLSEVPVAIRRGRARIDQIDQGTRER